MLTMIFACDLQNAIGKDGDLPWRQSTDLQHFKKITLGGTIVMGRKTWESLPGKLPERRHLVMTRSNRDDIETTTFEEVIKLSMEQNVFVIGGGEIYKLFFDIVNRLYLTNVEKYIDGDVFFPEIDLSKWNVIKKEEFPMNTERKIGFSLEILERI